MGRDKLFLITPSLYNSQASLSYWRRPGGRRHSWGEADVV